MKKRVGFFPHLNMHARQVPVTINMLLFCFIIEALCILDKNMPRIAQRLAIFAAVTASIIGYLLYAPNTEGIAQLNRVRALGATMKITHLIVCNLMIIFVSDFLHFCRVQQLNY
jgi:uncharacterized membrane protein